MTEPEKNKLMIEFILYVDKINGSSNFTYNALTEIIAKEPEIRKMLGWFWKSEIIKLAKTLLLTGVIDELPNEESYFTYIDPPKGNKKNQ